ncbi:hypothetical protein GMLC_19360 [Geomonas limicola]|uniref:DUF1638 domain-containing protein n=1 Tax=Geomonas limicola TaxID=2740186 RepID=A0A6V8N988_9BACT|nr:DUF1638 domain-containing protein [Geomonas limicola]GFO68357.1 hypothetical protein GMLC_19360 [Geomonas limicola]
MKAGTLWLSCGVLRPELEELLRTSRIDGTLLCLDSMLHMEPTKLEQALTTTLERLSKRAATVVLVYGDCAAHLLDIVKRFKVVRIPFINCAQLLVGRERYRQLMREGAFLVLPEWAPKWEQIIKNELGLDRGVAHDLMSEHRGVLVYLDTGIVEVPLELLREFSAYTGLTWRVEPISLDLMLESLLAAQSEPLQAHPAKERA